MRGLVIGFVKFPGLVGVERGEVEVQMAAAQSSASAGVVRVSGRGRASP